MWLISRQARISHCWHLGGDAIHGLRVRPNLYIARAPIDLLRRGYLESCRSIVSAAKAIAAGVKTIPELFVLGNPPASVVAFSSKSPRVNVHAVGDNMSKRGWHLNAVTNPDAVHIAVTVRSAPFILPLA